MKSWRKFPEEKPSKDGRYLIFCGQIFIARYQSTNEKWKNETVPTSLNQNVDYWMNLPDSPKNN